MTALKKKKNPAARAKPAAENSFRLVLDAVSFAARAHHGQTRRDAKTPYVSHPYRVALTLRHLFGVTDERSLAAAVLHDIFEDTLRDFEDVEEKFGSLVASYVALLSKDSRLPEALREYAYLSQLKDAPLPVKMIKTADLYDNVQDCRTAQPDRKARLLKLAREWLKTFRRAPQPEFRFALGCLESAVRAAVKKS